MVRYIYHHYIGIIALATILSVFAGFFAAKLAQNIKTDFADLLSDDYVSVSELNRIKARIGGIGPLMVVITSDDLEAAVSFMQVLADSLEHSPLISSVSRFDSKKELLEKNQLLYMDLADLQEINLRPRRAHRTCKSSSSRRSTLPWTTRKSRYSIFRISRPSTSRMAGRPRSQRNIASTSSRERATASFSGSIRPGLPQMSSSHRP